jgi:hypothetical protein
MKTSFSRRPVVLAVMMAGLSPLLGTAADGPAAGASAGPKAVSLQTIAGSTVKRITLTPKAAERLDIQTSKVGSEVVIRKQMVSGMVIYPQATPAGTPPPTPAAAGGGFGGFGGGAIKPVVLTPASTSTAPPTPSTPVAQGESWVVVSLSPGEFERINKDKPARITPLYTRDKQMQAMDAVLSDQPPTEDSKRSMLSLRYKLPSSDHGLAPSTRVRVELQLAGSEDKQKVVPYSSIHYDAKGAPWVYVTSQPLVYERQRVTVQRVVGNAAVISDGPEVGTQVVTVGASLLYGTEIFGK